MCFLPAEAFIFTYSLLQEDFILLYLLQFVVIILMYSWPPEALFYCVLNDLRLLFYCLQLPVFFLFSWIAYQLNVLFSFITLHLCRMFSSIVFHINVLLSCIIIPPTFLFYLKGKRSYVTVLATTNNCSQNLTFNYFIALYFFPISVAFHFTLWLRLSFEWEFCIPICSDVT